ncbi:hypothetical protein A8U91_00370 [Halomonas elongata]|uniref:Uncharacterized protein n=1 Tax=Halomonas elongata TaxID=2746 RepID=A0A1B8P1A2_HALEL|nr:hypothetical protein [Halomonas elongata]OBX36034.1 hypothetical protein A8U91_00370 [Halomonas elongata]
MTPAIIAFVVVLLIGAPVAVVMAISGVAGVYSLGESAWSASSPTACSPVSPATC